MSEHRRVPGWGWPPWLSSLTGVPLVVADAIDPALLNFETWAGDEATSRSAQEYVTAVTGGAVVAVTFPAPDAGDGLTSGICALTLTGDPVGVKGAMRRQSNDVFAADGFTTDRKRFFAHRFRMQSLVPDGTNYEIAAGGLVDVTGSASNDYSDGVFLYYDRTPGVVSWVVRCARAGVPVDVDLSLPWDNAFHTLGFLHDGDNVRTFLDGVMLGVESGPTIQPAQPSGPSAMHLRSGIAALDHGTIQSDWVAWGPVR